MPDDDHISDDLTASAVSEYSSGAPTSRNNPCARALRASNPCAVSHRPCERAASDRRYADEAAKQPNRSNVSKLSLKFSPAASDHRYASTCWPCHSWYHRGLLSLVCVNRLALSASGPPAAIDVSSRRCLMMTTSVILQSIPYLAAIAVSSRHALVRMLVASGHP
jgi:hypothetical protein